ncbi:MAG: right-handed parallel beta-helix repeat-containing protein, partial [Anaerolineales bacterium]
ASDDYTQFEWFETIRTGGVNGRAAVNVLNATNVTLSNLLIHDYTTGSSAYGIKGSASSSFTVRNCIIYDGQSSGIRLNDATSTATVENCTIYGITGTGVNENAGVLTVTNTISMGNSTDFSVVSGTQSYNLSSDATATGTGSIPSKLPANQFVSLTVGFEDLHLKAGSDAFDVGTSLSGSFTDDIDGDSRPQGVQWDIGADEDYSPPLAAIYYSVGTDNTALYTGSASASGGTLTLASAAANNIGVGDEVRVGANRYYITGRSSSTVFAIQNSAANGGTPGDTTITFASTAITIYRAFNSLSVAQIDSSDINHLVTSDLVAGNYQLNWPAYNDGAMDDILDLSGWTTGSANYIRLYTPTASTEVGTSQRHAGVAGTGFRLAPVDATQAGYNIIYLKTGYVRIEGIEIDGSGLTNADYVRGITMLKNMSNVGDIRIDSTIIHDLHTSAGTYAWEGSFGIWDLHETTNAGPPMTITNNVIYDVYGNIDTGHIGGMLIGSRTTSYVYNNTVYNIFNEGGAVSGGAAWGIYAKSWPSGTGSATVIAKNNYCGLVSAPQDPVEKCFDAIDSGILTQSYNVSSDLTASGIGSQTGMSAYGSYFMSIVAGSENLHLTDTSANLWTAPGDDLSGSFTLDVDGETRTVSWDIGADEYTGPPWLNASWQYRKQITIQSSQVDTNLTNFPVFIDLADLGSDFFSNVNSDGGDIRVTNSDGTTEMAREVVAINTGALTGELHFRADSLSSASNTSFYIYYGNIGASDYAVTAIYGRNNVWSNGYDAVWHLEEDAGGTGSLNLYVDSTGNGNDGDDQITATGQLGKLGNGQELDGLADYIDMGDVLDYPDPADFTLESWIRPTISGLPLGDQMTFISKWGGSGSDRSYRFEVETDATLTLLLGGGAIGINSSTVMVTDTWYQAAVTVSQSSDEVRLYLDGTEESSNLAVTNALGNSTYGFNLGRRADAATPQWFDGNLDEARVSSTIRSAGWLSTGFNNQDSPSTFYNVGAQET